MLKRKYKFVNLHDTTVLVVEFFDASLNTLSDFMNTEVVQFSDIILKELESVVLHKIKKYEFSGNMLSIECNRHSVTISHLIDDIHDKLGTSILPTNDFYRLIKEFVCLQKQLKCGKSYTLPLDVKDGEWLC